MEVEYKMKSMNVGLKCSISSCSPSYFEVHVVQGDVSKLDSYIFNGHFPRSWALYVLLLCMLICNTGQHVMVLVCY